MNDEFNELIGILVSMMEREDLPKAVAKFYWNLYENLIAEGFSSEVAVELLKVMNLPGATKS